MHFRALHGPLRCRDPRGGAAARRRGEGPALRAIGFAARTPAQRTRRQLTDPHAARYGPRVVRGSVRILWGAGDRPSAPVAGERAPAAWTPFPPRGRPQMSPGRPPPPRAWRSSAAPHAAPRSSRPCQPRPGRGPRTTSGVSPGAGPHAAWCTLRLSALNPHAPRRRPRHHTPRPRPRPRPRSPTPGARRHTFCSSSSFSRSARARTSAATASVRARSSCARSSPMSPRSVSTSMRAADGPASPSRPRVALAVDGRCGGGAEAPPRLFACPHPRALARSQQRVSAPLSITSFVRAWRVRGVSPRAAPL